MSRILLPSLLIGLLALPAGAAAQDADRGGRAERSWGGGDRRGPEAGIRPGPGTAGWEDRRGGRDGDGGRFDRDRGGRDWADRGGIDRRDRDGWRDGRRDGFDRSGDWRGAGPGRGPDRWGGGDWRADRNRGGWNDRWRDDRRYDWRGWRAGHRDAYRLPRYYAPRGFAGGYRRWGPGYRLDPGFYGRSYWIADPYAYRLPPVSGRYRWVRYYDDVMLVDTGSGLIRDILYSFFW
ncbi:MAG: RcnB family protein [Sphingomonas fennica]